MHISILRIDWNRKKIFVVVILISFAYGIWFNYLDSAKYCLDSEDILKIKEGIQKTNIIISASDWEKIIQSISTTNICKDIGQILGDNSIYQPWNIIGHCLPGLFLICMIPKKWELFIVGILLSTAIMDSPLWGIMRLAHDLPLWHIVNGQFQDTTNIMDWIFFYYNPIGTYQVWKDSWPIDGQPTAALIFWSVVGRISLGILLIVRQKIQDLQKNTSSNKGEFDNKKSNFDVE